MITQINKIGLLAAFLLLSFVLPSLGDDTGSEPRLVQTTPLETHLHHPDMPQATEVWIEMIQGAKHSMDLGNMYLSSASGEAMEKILVELEVAAKRGVHLRLLLSKQMFGNDPKSLERVRAFPNTEVRALDLTPTGGILHAKYWII